jgi:hypothetical protein
MVCGYLNHISKSNIRGERVLSEVVLKSVRGQLKFQSRPYVKRPSELVKVNEVRTWFYSYNVKLLQEVTTLRAYAINP